MKKQRALKNLCRQCSTHGANARMHKLHRKTFKWLLLSLASFLPMNAKTHRRRYTRKWTHRSLNTIPVNLLQRAKEHCGRGRSQSSFDDDLLLRFKAAFCIKRNYIMCSILVNVMARRLLHYWCRHCSANGKWSSKCEKNRNAIEKKPIENYCPFCVALCRPSDSHCSRCFLLHSFLLAQTDIFILRTVCIA